MTANPPEGITAGPVKEENFFIWEALIEGPPGTPFEGGVFAAQLNFPRDYPLSPPNMRFTSRIFHPNGINSCFHLFSIYHFVVSSLFLLFLFSLS